MSKKKWKYLSVEREDCVLTVGTEYATEGARAFFEKRKADFKGN